MTATPAPKSWGRNAYIYGVYGLKATVGFGIYIVASIMAIALLPWLFLGCGCKRARFQWLIRFLIRHYFALVMWYIRAMGAIDVRRRYYTREALAPILIGNHISLFDILSTLAYVPECITFMKRRYWRIPIVYPLARCAGYIPIDHANVAQRVGALQSAAKHLQGGGRLIIFPEGTRTKTGEMSPFEVGAFHLAMTLGIKEITPIIFTSSQPLYGHQARRPLSLERVAYRLHILPPIPVPAGAARRESVQSFSDSVRAEMQQWQAQYAGEF